MHSFGAARLHALEWSASAAQPSAAASGATARLVSRLQAAQAAGRSGDASLTLALASLTQDAYMGVATEFCAEAPNFTALVETGAMAPQLAALLQARLVLALALTLTLTLALILP